MHGTLRLFPVFISPIVWNMCEHLIMNRYISKSYTRSKNTIYRAGAAVVSTITSVINNFVFSLNRVSFFGFAGGAHNQDFSAVSQGDLTRSLVLSVAQASPLGINV